MVVANADEVRSQTLSLSKCRIPIQLYTREVALSPAELPALDACNNTEHLIQAACVQARVGDKLRVLVTPPKACQRCANQGACELGVLRRWFGRKKHIVTLTVQTASYIPAGSWIWLGFAKADFLRCILMLYICPIVLLLLGGLLGIGLGSTFTTLQLGA